MTKTTDARDGLPRRTIRGVTLVELLAVTAIIGSLAAIGIPRYRTVIDRAKVAKAIGDIEAIGLSLDVQDTLPDNLSSLGTMPKDPWGFDYVYNKFDPTRNVPAGARRDRFLVPINSKFDLYSVGPDGRSSPPLNAGPSRDDVVRANDGGFIGLASQY
ncbi:MAG TPA: prepilin-type N-terminal cleavage/methylation domain-containing protein [Gemmatimonadales bacterium]|nr:prepilin-type N-terminal cleavage/methylation domain-containing protein [Gemmatimonadales bacterium]